jgi:hypothetical protein
MRVTINHNKGTEGAIEVIDRRIAEALKNLQSAPVEILNLERSWQGSTLTFSFTAKKGFLKGPVKGTVEVADTLVVVTVDAGMFQHFIPEEKAQEAIRSKMRELLA